MSSLDTVIRRAQEHSRGAGELAQPVIKLVIRHATNTVADGRSRRSGSIIGMRLLFPYFLATDLLRGLSLPPVDDGCEDLDEIDEERQETHYCLALAVKMPATNSTAE